MKTPIKPEHLPHPSAPLGDVSAGGCFYPEDDRALWIATATTHTFYATQEGDSPVVQEANARKQERECVRLHDGRAELLDVHLPVVPVEFEAREVPIPVPVPFDW